MFEAELANKIPEIKAHEDYLTSCIFGALKYLPPKDGIFPILGEALNYKLNKKLKDYLASKGLPLENFEKAELYFWPRSPKYGEPDIVMLIKDKNSSYIMAIEVKYFSYKHGEGEYDQLKRYFAGLSTNKNRTTFACDAIKEFSGDLLAIIYLTQFEAREEIADTLSALAKEDKKDVSNRFFHLKWQNVAGVIENLCLGEKDLYRKKIYDDIYKLLDFKNLMPFKGFSSLQKKIGLEQLLTLPIFFGAPKMILNMQFNGYSSIPKKLKIDYDKVIYYGG